MDTHLSCFSTSFLSLASGSYSSLKHNRFALLTELSQFPSYMLPQFTDGIMREWKRAQALESGGLNVNLA
jgi:hypothetical protein